MRSVFLQHTMPVQYVHSQARGDVGGSVLKLKLTPKGATMRSHPN